MRGLRPTRLGRVDLPRQSLLFCPLRLEHVLRGLAGGVELRLGLRFYYRLQRLRVGALPLGGQILRSSFELFRRTVLDEVTADAALLADVAWWRVAEPRDAQSYSRAVLHIMPGDAAPPTHIVAGRDASSLLTCDR